MPANHTPLPRAAIWADLFQQATCIHNPIFQTRALAGLLPAARELLLPCQKPLDALTRCVRSAHGSPPFALLSWLAAEIERCASAPGDSGLALADAAAALTRPGRADVNVARALLAAGAREPLSRLGPAFGPHARALVRTGALPLPGPASRDPLRVADAFVGDLSRPGSEARFAPSLALVAGCAQAAVRHPRPALALRMSDCLPALSRAARTRARVHLAVAEYALRGRVYGLARARALRAQGQRRVALLMLVRAALSRRAFLDAYAFLDTMEPSLWRQRASLLLADALSERGLVERTRAQLAGVTHPRLAHHRALIEARTRLFDVERATPPLAIWDDLARMTLPAGGGHRAYESPRELPWTIAGERALLMAQAIAVRLARAPDASRDANGHLARLLSLLSGVPAVLRDERGARRLLAVFGDDQAAPMSVLRALYHPAERWRRDLLASVDIRARARRLCAGAESDALVDDRERAMADGLAGAAPPPRRASEFRDAHSAYRTYYDEGVALSARAHERRKVLWHASRYCLRQALRGAGALDIALLRARLRIVANLAGPGITVGLSRLLGEEPCGQPAYLEALATLIRLDARAAARIALSRLGELAAAGQNIDDVLGALEDGGGLPEGYARECALLLAALAAELPEGTAVDWLQEAIDAGEECGAGVADLWFLRGLRAQLARSRIGVKSPRHRPGLDGNRPPCGRQLLGDARRALLALIQRPPRALLDALCQTPAHLQIMHWLAPPSLPARAPTWTPERWRTIIQRSQLGRHRAIEKTLVRSLSRRLAATSRSGANVRQSAIERALRAGEFPVPGASERISLGTFGQKGRRHRLRFLDKRRDVLTYLRFADVAQCCFNSASAYYDCRCHDYRRWVIALFQDPLSFCFHIERERTRTGPDEPVLFEPIGFVFGGYGLVAGKRRRALATPVLLLNGVYLQRQNAPLRAAVLSSVEREMCAPLGIAQMGVGNVHAGCGTLPQRYRKRSVALTRVRALVHKGQLVTEVYDDISTVVNTPVVLDHLWWTEVPRTARRSPVRARVERPAQPAILAA